MFWKLINKSLLTGKMHFENKVVWITGASSGIGAALVAQFAAQNARLILTSRNEQALQEIKENCGNAACAVLPGDMLQPETFHGMVNKAILIYGRIDIVIFCAGQSQRSFANDTDIQVHRHLMEINYFAPVALTQILTPHFSEQKSGHVVVIGSIAGLMGFPLRSGYVASKHALKGFYETLQTETFLPDFHVTIVSPGRVNTSISVNSITGNGQQYGQMDEGQLNGISADVCAKKIVRAIEKKQRHIMIAKQERLLWWIWWFARPLYYTIARAKAIELKTKKPDKKAC